MEEQKVKSSNPGDQYVFPALGGLTVRQLLAGLAMMGLMDPDVDISLPSQECARQAVMQADALIARLAATQSRAGGGDGDDGAGH